MSTNIPGTIYRCYADDGRHWTAVIRSGGKVLEVKNPDAGVARGATFDTVDEWVAARGGSCVENDTSKVSGMKKVKDTHGFKYDWSKNMWSRVTNWIYEMMEEGTPHLLASEEIRDEFNKLVELFETYKGGMKCWTCKRDRYYSNMLIPCNLPFAYPVMPHVIPASEGYNIIISAYGNGLRKHIDDVVTYIKRIEEIKRLKRYIKYDTNKLWRKQYIANRANKELEYVKAVHSKHTKRLLELETLTAAK